MYFGEVKFKELLDKIKEQSERMGTIKYSLDLVEIENLYLEIKNTENKLIELFMSRYNK